MPRIKQDSNKNIQTLSDTTEWLKTQINDFEPRNSKILAVDLFIKLKSTYKEKLASKRLDLQFEGDESVMFMSDPFLVIFILEKLLDNAIKYSHANKTIHFKAFRQNNSTYLCITDYGLGMDKNTQENIFSFQTPVFKGTNGEIGAGLSLNIFGNFVSLVNGNIKVDSTENEGSKFTIILP